MATQLVISGQVALETLADHEATFLAASMAKNTIRAYRASWTHFETWCGERGLRAVPATVDTVCTYLSLQAAEGSKVTTLATRLAAIRHVHNSVGYASPTDESKLKLLMRGIRRKVGVTPKSKVALTVAQVRALIEAAE
jgi:site-specific recombinase XerD